ncbi:type IV pilus biogenesis protein PilM [Pseudomonas oryzihabitans]|uniref:type IV pilus biogenesis protein PilM n=1 Tax=Pseudomonas oryzihabitans TaxID=47885 RepID=UPI0018D61B54|nr:type IV pilus biogenesis protein PilM [Pseudomonas oryzihabitans]MBH3329862.1 type IV pilus biogenesis protein PilM [Pseudomonas oryzihabitans]
MPLIWIILVVMLGASGLLSDQLQRSDNRRVAVDVSALAHNLLIYRNALAEYAYNNPSVTGTPADSALSLPNWWIHAPGVSGYVHGGLSYTFYASPPSGLVTTLAELTHSVAVGYASGGQLMSPTGGVMGVILPPAVPAGAAVAYR